MKTQTKQSKIIVLMSAVILLLVALSATLTYAYFTGKVETTGDDLQFGEMALSGSEMSITKVGSFDDNLVPGDTINLGGSISLTGDILAFVRTKMDVFIAKKTAIVTSAVEDTDGGFTVEKTPVNDATAVYVKSADSSKDLVKLGNAYYELQSQAHQTGAGTSKAEIIYGKINAQMGTGTAEWISYTDGYLYHNTAIQAGSEGTTVLSFQNKNILLEKAGFDNSWQGLRIIVSISAQAIQADHLEVAEADDEFALEPTGSQVNVSVLAGEADAWAAVSTNVYGA